MDPSYSIYYISVRLGAKFETFFNFLFKFGNCIVMSLIPVSLLAVLNTIIYKGIQR